MMNPYLIPVLQFGPRILKRLVSQLEPSEVDQPTGTGRFTPREIIAHLADWEPIMLARIEQAVQHPGSTVEPFDEGELAIAHNYAQSDIQQQLELFASSRGATETFLKSLKSDDWSKTITHPERGRLTVMEQAFTLIGHDMYHIEQLTALH